MDPLSCAASVIAVIQFAGALVDLCENYIKKVKNAQKDINDLIGEINSLKSILESLNKFVQEPGSARLVALREISDNAGKCTTILKNLGNRIDPEAAQTSTWRRKFRQWKWPLQRHEVDESINQLKRYISLFTMAMQLDQQYVTTHSYPIL